MFYCVYVGSEVIVVLSAHVENNWFLRLLNTFHLSSERLLQFLKLSGKSKLFSTPPTN